MNDNDFMVLVERAVRPVTAGPKKKTRMREELLAHLTGVYEQELARLGDEQKARAEAIRRFGDPAALTAELQATTTFQDRLDARLNRAFGWRPGESAVRYSARLAGLIALVMIGTSWLALVIALSANPQMDPWDGLVLRCGLHFLVLGSAVVFLISLLGIRVRDSLWGAFGTPKSRNRALAYALLLYLLLPAITFACERLLLPELREFNEQLSAGRSLGIAAAVYLIVPVWVLFHARKTGPGEIRRVEWASLDIGR